jgi:transcription elongation factor Elf1
MKNILDDQPIELACPHCGHKLKERIGKLKTNPKLTCGSCRGHIEIKADQMRGEIAKVEKALADLQRTLGRIGK